MEHAVDKFMNPWHRNGSFVIVLLMFPIHRLKQSCQVKCCGILNEKLFRSYRGYDFGSGFIARCASGWACVHAVTYFQRAAGWFYMQNGCCRCVFQVLVYLNVLSCQGEPGERGPRKKEVREEMQVCDSSWTWFTTDGYCLEFQGHDLMLRSPSISQTL